MLKQPDQRRRPLRSRQGRTIFGLEYRALPKGPVPTKLYDEIKSGGAVDLKQGVLERLGVYFGTEETYRPQRPMSVH